MLVLEGRVRHPLGRGAGILSVPRFAHLADSVTLSDTWMALLGQRLLRGYRGRVWLSQGLGGAAGIRVGCRVLRSAELSRSGLSRLSERPGGQGTVG